VSVAYRTLEQLDAVAEKLAAGPGLKRPADAA